MIYRALGNTGFNVSAIGLGCEGFVGRTDDEAKAMMDYAVEAGINFIDIYSSDPVLRTTIGTALRGHRPHFFIQGHVGTVWKNGQYERTRNVDEAKASFADLLTRLETDYVDVGMIHYNDQVDDFHAIFDTEFITFVQALKAEGKIRAIGISSHNPVVARMAVETGLIDVLMFSVNPCYDVQPPNEDIEQLWADDVYQKEFHNFDPERVALYELCAQKGVGIDVMKVYAGGDLLSDERSLFGKAMTPVQALEYALTRPAVASVMVGCKSVAEIRAALAWCEASPEQKDYAKLFATLPKCSWSGHCMYCGHCAPCPKGISVANVNQFLSLALTQKTVPETVREHYKVLPHHASECIQCGACEKRCPFNVPIREKMKLASQLFGE